MCRRFEGIATTFAAIAYLACGEGQRAATSEPEETVSDTVNMSVEPLDFASASERPVPAPVSPPPSRGRLGPEATFETTAVQRSSVILSRRYGTGNEVGLWAPGAVLHHAKRRASRPL